MSSTALSNGKRSKTTDSGTHIPERRRLFCGVALATAIQCACASPSKDTAFLAIRTPISVSIAAGEIDPVVVFVDSRVPDSELILANLAPNAEIVRLTEDEDGLMQIARSLQGHTDVQALHIVSHGEPGALLLGRSSVSTDDLDARSSELQIISNALSPDGDILLYGCDVGAGDAGKEFVNKFAVATGGDIAASEDKTGGVVQGGDWDLEIVTGAVDSSGVADLMALNVYPDVLHTASVNSVAQLKAAIATGNTDGVADTITLTGNITFASAVDAVTINVTDGETLTIVGGEFTLDAAYRARALNITAGSVDIQNLTITHGLVSGAGANGGDALSGDNAYGGAILNAGDLTLTDVTMTLNMATGGGGGGGLQPGNVGGGGGGGSGAAGVGGGNGGNSGASYYSGTAGGAGSGGNGGGYLTMGGRGGNAGAGAGGIGIYGYANGGAGGAGTAGGVTIGGGGGGAGWDANGGTGGGAAGAIYNTGTLTILGTSAITNNIGAGGGGGGGGGLNNHAGLGGLGVGAIWNAGGTVQITSSNYAAMTANAAASGSIGSVTNSGSNAGFVSPAAVAKIYNAGGTLNTSYALTPTVSDGNISISGASGSGAAYKIGDTVTATWNNTAGGDNNAGVINVTVNFSQFGGGAAVAASESSGTWTATYTIVSGAVDTNNRNVSVTASNASGDTTTADTTNVVVDNAAPTVTHARISISGASGVGGAYTLGDTVTATWNNTAGGDNNGDTISSATVDFSQFGGGAAVAATNSSGTWTATYTIASGALEATNRNVSVTASDNAGNTTTTEDTSNASVDNAAPTVSDANVSIVGASGTAGAYRIGDTVTASWNNTAGGDNNSDTISSTTVNFSAFGGGSSVAASNSSGTWTATYTITSGVVDATNRNLSVTATDNAGNTTTRADTTNATVDNLPPTVTDANISISGASGTGGAYKVGDTVTATWNNTAGGDSNSDAISSSTVNFSDFGGGAAVVATSSGGTWTATYTITAGAIEAANLNVSVTTTDNAGNSTTTADSTNATVDSGAPTVTDANFSISGATGTGGAYKVGDTVTATWNNTASGDNNSDTIGSVTVDFSQFGGGAAVAATNSSGTWTATYTIVAGAIDGTNRNVSVTASDNAGNTTITADTTNATVDNAAPTVSNANVSISGASGTAGAYKIGDTLTATWNNTAGGDNNSDTISSVTVDFSQFGGGAAVAATNSSGTWTATYTITSGAIDATNRNVSITASDNAGNNTTTGDTSNATVDNASPTVTSVSVPANDVYVAAETLSFTVNTTENVVVNTGGGEPRIALTIGAATRYATYAGGSASTALVFSYTVQAGDNDGDGIALAAAIASNGATLRDSSGNNLTLTLNSVGATGNVRVDASAPAAPSTPDLAAASDSGNSNADNITNDTTPTLTGTAEANGTVTVSNQSGSLGSTTANGSGDWSFTPGAALSQGALSITATTTDAAGNISAASGTLSITVDTTAPAAPSAPDLAAASDTGTSSTDNITNDTTPTLTGTAEANSTVTLNSNQSGALGTTSAAGGNWSITPSSALSESAHSLTATATDAAGNTSPASSALSVTIDTTAPTADDDTAVTDEDNSVAVNVLANDSDTGSSLNAASVTVVSAPVKGSTSVNTGTGVVTYIPDADFNGTDTFTYTVDDLQNGTSAPATVTITVNPTNDAPNAAGDTASTEEDTAVLIDVANNDSDLDTGDAVDPATLSIVTTPTDGVATIESGQIRYTPGPNFIGTDQLTYTIDDENDATSVAALVVINVGSVNDAPTAANDTANTDEDTTTIIDVLGNDSDLDGTLEPSTVIVLTAPGEGAATVNTTNGEITYTPNADFNGSDSFTYVVGDNGGASSSAATVTITVASVNDAPMAANDVATLQEDVPHNINVLGNDSDDDGTLMPASVAVVTQPAHGSAIVNTTNGAITYSPSDHFNGADIFTYRVRDDAGVWSQVATVTLTVQTINDAPLANDDSAVTNEDVAVEIEVLANDSDVDGVMDASSVTLETAPIHGTVVIVSGSVTYTPERNWSGAESFTYSVADSSGGRSNSATVSIVVNAINDLPVISGTPAGAITSGQAYLFTPVLDDEESQSLSVSATNLPGWAALNASTGAITGIPRHEDAGTYSGIVLTVSDGSDSISLPAFSIVVTRATDRDGDGMSDEFEGAHGLDPLNAGDAGADLDGDGASNLDEYVAQRNPAIDDYPPIVSSPAPITIDATGLLTIIPTLTPPSALDGRDGTVTAQLAEAQKYLAPGVYILAWQATDAAGNRGETLQAINVRPLVSLAADQTSAEGASAQVRFVLNGVSPNYPLSVAYTVSGTAAADDHDLTSGSVVFLNGEIEKKVTVEIAKDTVAEGEETIEVALVGDGNFGTQRRHIIRIVEANAAPNVSWSLVQAGREARILTQDSGLVTLTAIAHDPNPNDTHIYEWNIPAAVATTSVGESVKRFDPSLLIPGVYRIELTVHDDGSPQQSTRAVEIFSVIAAAPTLSDSADSDGDGLDDVAEGLGDQDRDGQPDYLDAIALPNVINENAGDSGLFLIESDPGVALSLGRRALNHGSDGAQLGDEEIFADGDIPPDGIRNVGGYVDLRMRELPKVGASVNLVIPQRRQIPQHPLYRKFINGQWITFVENEHNQLASAPGAAGVCPVPGGSEYRPGLNPGDWCVRLTLEDGGPNDADGIANAEVEDPGGVGEIVNVTSTTKGGGGAMGLPILLLALGTVLCRARRRAIRRSVAASTLLAVVVALPVQAQSDDSAWWRSLYVTGVLGYAHTDASESELERAFAAQGISGTVHSVDSRREGWGLGVGYPLGRRWAIETGYLDLGKVDLRFDALANAANLAQVHPTSGKGATLSGLYRFPLGERFGVRARLGAFAWDAEYGTRSGSGLIDTQDDSGTDLLWGIGVGYDVSGQWIIDLELQRIEFERDPTHFIGLRVQWGG